MSYGMVPPPASLTTSAGGSRRNITLPEASEKRTQDKKKEEEYVSLTHGYKSSGGSNVRKRLADDAYFDDDSDEEELETRRSGSSSRSSHERHRPSKTDDDDEEEDPLDAFMAGVEAQARKDCGDSVKKQEKVASTGEYSGGQTGRDDIEEMDMVESQIKFLEEYEARHEEQEQDVEYDEDGNVIWTWKKTIDPLPDVDHSTIGYKPFNKYLYQEHEDIAKLSPKEVFELRAAMDVRVFGSHPPKPVVSFGHFSFDEPIMKNVRKSEYAKPTPIQAQAVPAALSGRDVLGLAQTGSGKTLAYVWPLIVHIMNQDELEAGEGPIGLVVVPTRELAIQVYQHAKPYCRAYNINAVCAYGGGNKYEQQKALEEGAELVIGTPGRIIDMVKMGATNFFRTSFLVFDEADRMFDLGFEPQVKSISEHIRPDRQCLMFSATFKKKVEKLAAHSLDNPVKVVCGDVGESSEDVAQSIHVLANADAKWQWLCSRIVELCSMGKVLIFVTKKIDAEDLARKLKLRDVNLVLLHGDMFQNDRNDQITSFRSTVPVMVATDVAARGLDIPEIRNVINFDVARDIDTHVHRIGRTGRAGQKGFAHTLVTEADKEFAGHLVRNLESIGQEVPNALYQIAMKSSWFAKQQKDKGQSFGGSTKQRPGLGFKPKERPGFGSSDSATASLAFSSAPSVSRVVSKAKSFASSSGSAGMNRLEMMKSAMKSSFQHTFQRASGDERASSHFPSAAASAPAQPPSSAHSDVSFGRKKKSRWE